MYVQPLEGPLAGGSLSAPLTGLAEQGPFFNGAAAPSAGDNISRSLPPWLNDGAAASPYGEAGYGNSSLQGLFGPLMGMLQQLMAMLQSLMGYGGYGGSGCGGPYGGGNGSCQPFGNEQFFQNASGGSEGDPHLSFNGARWTNMASQPDLLNSDSFAGGYQVSTQTTPPNGKGVTWNQSATIALNNGATTVSMDNNGQSTIVRDGQTLSIAPGQTLRLGDRESVSCAQNGSLTVTARNAAGGSIATTLAAKGNGVDVDVSAHDVDLGGALVEGAQGRPGQPTPPPFPNPFFGPIPGPSPQPWPIPVDSPYEFPPASAYAEPAAYPQ